MSALAMRIAQLDLLIPYGLEHLLALIDVEESESIPTAAIPIGGRPKILINPLFVEKHCKDDDALAALVLHELHHLLLGHTRLFQRINPIHNIAFDAIINAMLARQEPRYSTLFTQLYRPDTFPECLLRPPKGFPYTPRYPSSLSPDIQMLLRELYYSTQSTFLEVYELLLQNATLITIAPVLIGNHEEDTRGYEMDDDPDLFAAIRNIVERWPQPKDPKIGRSLRAVFEKKNLHIQEKEKPEDVFIRAIKNLAQHGSTPLDNHTQRHNHTLQQVWPNLRDRRSFAFAQSGTFPLLYQNTLPNRPCTEKVTFYFDVSGSMNQFLNDAASAITRCAQWIKDELYLFSTKIFPISRSEFKKGHYRSTGGTNFEIVAQHIHENNIHSAIILTDGYVGPTPRPYLKACKRANIQVILTPNGYSEDLKPIATHIHFLGEYS